jgi:hypothetical protein
MKRRKALMFTAAILLVGLMVAGCGGSSGEAKKVMDQALKNLKALESFKLAMKSAAASKPDSSSPASESTATVEVTTVDGTKMHTVMDYSGTKVEQYQIGDTTYAYMEGQGWAKQQSASSDPLNVEIAKALSTDLKDLKILSEDADSYKLSFKIPGESSAQGSATSSSTEEASDVEFVVTVDKATKNITKMTVKSSTGSGSDKQTQVQTYTFSNLNEPVTITLPEEAKNAQSAADTQQSTP